MQPRNEIKFSESEIFKVAVKLLHDTNDGDFGLVYLHQLNEVINGSRVAADWVLANIFMYDRNLAVIFTPDLAKRLLDQANKSDCQHASVLTFAALSHYKSNPQHVFTADDWVTMGLEGRCFLDRAIALGDTNAMAIKSMLSDLHDDERQTLLTKAAAAGDSVLSLLCPEKMHVQSADHIFSVLSLMLGEEKKANKQFHPRDYVEMARLNRKATTLGLDNAFKSIFFRTYAINEFMQEFNKIAVADSEKPSGSEKYLEVLFHLIMARKSQTALPYELTLFYKAYPKIFTRFLLADLKDDVLDEVGKKQVAEFLEPELKKLYRSERQLHRHEKREIKALRADETRRHEAIVAGLSKVKSLSSYSGALFAPQPETSAIPVLQTPGVSTR